MIYILTSEQDSHRDIVQYFEAHGARFVDTTAPQGASGPVISGRGAFVLSMLRARLWPLRRMINRDDRVIVYGWHAIPLLLLMKLRLLPRPRRLFVTSLYIQSQRTRRMVNRLIRWFGIGELEVIAYSPSEVEHLVKEAGIERSRVHFQIWRLELDGRAPPSAVRDNGYIFSGGYSNRDYDSLLRATAGTDLPVVIGASRRNEIAEVPGPQVRMHFDIPENEFELLLAGSRVCVIPLQDESDACGLSVLLRVLRNGKALIATRHSSIEAYLGLDYPGFVTVGDVEGLRAQLQRTMTDSAYRAALEAAVRQAQVRLEHLDTPGAEVFKLVAA